MKELPQIQHRLKVPKGQYNKFGKYLYRNCEDILEAVKPLLAEYECSLILSDEIMVLDGTPVTNKTIEKSNNAQGAGDQSNESGQSKEVVSILPGQRFYIKSTATITNSDGESASAVGFAREDYVKKGMDSAQITGSASSYARKYALNGLLAIDDTVDPDAQGKVEDANSALQIALSRVAVAKTKDALEATWNRYTELHNSKEFVEAVNVRKAQVGI